MKTGYIVFTLVLFVSLLGGIFFLRQPGRVNQVLGIKQAISTPHPTPTITEERGRTRVKYPEDYTIVLVGDSMTERMGNSDELRTYLKKYYLNKTFEVLNYGYGATNILSLQDRLEKTTYYGREFRPILDIAFDLIIIESFGHNPLSSYTLEEGLKKHSEAMDKAITKVKEVNPKASIVLLSTIAPNKKKYALPSLDLSPSERERWANERIAYIKHHIEYARSRNLPLINVYEKSLGLGRDGNLLFINSDDLIHPSPRGIYLISKEVANYLFNNKLLRPN